MEIRIFTNFLLDTVCSPCIELFTGLTVVVEPPDAGEYVVVEDGPIWTEKCPLPGRGQTLVPSLVSVRQTDSRE